jgi:hypothetical protein
MLNLRELQSCFFQAIAHVPGVYTGEGCDPALLHVVQGRGPLGAQERIDIYANMYYLRLCNTLQEDFPSVATTLGNEQFSALVRAYLPLHPSTHPSLRYLGRQFPAFLATRAEVAVTPFLPDLARLEWARQEVFDAPDAEPLRLPDLQSIAPDEWPDLRLHLIPACEIIACAWNIHEIWKAAEEKDPTGDIACPQEVTLRVWRDGFTVYHAAMNAPERSALEAVRAGQSFAAVCDTLAHRLPAEEAAATVGSLLLRWIEDGLLAAM